MAPIGPEMAGGGWGGRSVVGIGMEWPEFGVLVVLMWG